MRLKRLTDDLESAESLFLTLGRIIEARDPCTEGHCDRLTDYATALGRQLGLTAPISMALHRGAFLHDVGKIAIPDRVLLKKGKLTRKEYELMKRHPVVGDELCRDRPIVRRGPRRSSAIITSVSTAAVIPDGLAGDRIPLLAQIVSIVDVFDALTTDRPYRKALSTATRLPDDARRRARRLVPGGSADGVHRAARGPARDHRAADRAGGARARGVIVKAGIAGRRAGPRAAAEPITPVVSHRSSRGLRGRTRASAELAQFAPQRPTGRGRLSASAGGTR